jgi:hypothetical protein
MKKKTYVILSKEELINSYNKDIKSIQNFLKISKEDSKILLSFYNWNTEKLLSDFFDQGKDFIFQKVGIDNFNKKEIQNEENQEIVNCPNCFEDVSIKLVFQNKCGHKVIEII